MLREGSYFASCHQLDNEPDYDDAELECALSLSQMTFEEERRMREDSLYASQLQDDFETDCALVMSLEQQADEQTERLLLEEALRMSEAEKKEVGNLVIDDCIDVIAAQAPNLKMADHDQVKLTAMQEIRSFIDGGNLSWIEMVKFCTTYPRVAGSIFLIYDILNPGSPQNALSEEEQELMRAFTQSEMHKEECDIAFLMVRMANLGSRTAEDYMKMINAALMHDKAITTLVKAVTRYFANGCIRNISHCRRHDHVCLSPVRLLLDGPIGGLQQMGTVSLTPYVSLNYDWMHCEDNVTCVRKSYQILMSKGRLTIVTIKEAPVCDLVAYVDESVRETGNLLHGGTGVVIATGIATQSYALPGRTVACKCRPHKPNDCRVKQDLLSEMTTLGIQHVLTYCPDEIRVLIYLDRDWAIPVIVDTLMRRCRNAFDIMAHKQLQLYIVTIQAHKGYCLLSAADRMAKESSLAQQKFFGRTFP
jgi:hypothetical protein